MKHFVTMVIGITVVILACSLEFAVLLGGQEAGIKDMRSCYALLLLLTFVGAGFVVMGLIGFYRQFIKPRLNPKDPEGD